MARSPNITSSERIELGREPSRRHSPEAFLQTFDVARVTISPGCYIMCDEKGRPIYVGKAKNLRARLRQYLNESDSRYSVKFLMKRVAHIELLVTTSEKEALLLENSLIKQHKPRYNFRLKDDKTYVSLRLNVQDEFPRLTVVRRVAIVDASNATKSASPVIPCSARTWKKILWASVPIGGTSGR